MTPFDPLQPLDHGTSLIEASAGTGKTWTITALVLRLIVEYGLSIREILVVTFTEAATAELQDRVRLRLRDALRLFRGRGGEDEFLAALRDRLESEGRLDTATLALQDALRDFDQATISTIHGFCNRALHSNAFESGVLFDIELQGDLSHLLEEVVADFWTLNLHDANPLFVRYLQRYKVTPHSLMSLARTVCSASSLEVLGLRQGAPPELVSDELEGRYAVLRALWQPHASGLLAALKKSGLKHPWYSLDRTAQAADDGLDHDRLTPPTKDLYTLTREGLCEGANRPHLPQEGQLASLLDALDAFYDEWTGQLEPLLHEHLMHLQSRLALQVRERFEDRKRSARSWSYDDLLTELDRALQGETGELLATAMRAETRAVLVDEFQDTDPIQYRIFSRVFGGRPDWWLYLIGDPKQAIYAFRGADIFAYLRAVQDAGSQRYTLDTNRRSDSGLVDALNAVYKRVVRPFVFKDIHYAPVKSAHGQRLVDDLEPVLIRWVSTRNKRYLTKRGVRRVTYDFRTDQLPQVLAEDVARLLALGTTIQPDPELEPRALEPGDIAILVRTNKEAGPIQAGLRELGIDSVLHAASNVLTTAEAWQLEQVMAAVAEPGNRRAVRSALTTELLGRSANDLVELEEGEGQDWDRWVEQLRLWRSLWEDQSFARMFRALVETGDTLPRVLGMPDGERRMTNLLHLNELLSSASANQDLGVNGLLRWFRGSRLEAADTKDMELRLESDARAVQITTIHKAKGLEWPVVLVTGLFHGSKGGSVPLSFHDRGRQDRHCLDLDEGGPSWQRHVAMARREERAEDARLLYVALTRAKHRVVLYHSPLNTFERSPIAQLLHQSAALTEDQALDQTIERVAKLDARAIYEELGLFVQRLGGVQVWEPQERPERWKGAGDGQAEATLSARSRRRGLLDGSWRIGSFSSLTRGERSPTGPVAEGKDLDAHAALPDPVEDEGEDILLGAFPKGAKAGTFFHDVLEHLDFRYQDTQTLLTLVEQRLKLHGYDPGVWTVTVAEAFQQTLDTALDDTGWGLRQLDNSDRINELQFTLPVSAGLEALDQRADLEARLTPEDLAGVFRVHRTRVVPASYADDLQALDFTGLHGFVTGFVDLIYRRDGRWWVVDYKSNHLGDQLSDYAQHRLPDAMAHGHYFLQYHLYCVALHRLLKLRQPGYSYDEHFGGAQYLFIKGMSPELGPSHGVFTDRPTLQMLEALSAAFGGPGA